MNRFRIFKATVKEGLQGLWKHRTMGIASVISIFLALFILGAIIISALTLNGAVHDIQKKVDQVDVFVNNNVTGDKLTEVKTNLEKIEGVGEIKLKSKEEALEAFKKTLKDDGYLLEGMEEAFPQSFVLKVNNINNAHEVVEKAKAVPGVTEVRYYKDLVDKVSKITKYVQLGGIIGVAALVGISILIISNTVKLTVLARKREIEIKKYIGATNAVISGPFIIEGIVFGLIGSAIAFSTVYFGYNFIYNSYGNAIFKLLATYLVKPSVLFMDLMIIFVTLGCGIGALGSIFSLRKYLKV